MLFSGVIPLNISFPVSSSLLTPYVGGGGKKANFAAMFDVTLPISIRIIVQKKGKRKKLSMRKKEKTKTQTPKSLPPSLFGSKKRKQKKLKKLFVFGGFMFRGEEGNQMEGDGGEYLAGERS